MGAWLRVTWTVAIVLLLGWYVGVVRWPAPEAKRPTLAEPLKPNSPLPGPAVAPVEVEKPKKIVKRRVVRKRAKPAAVVSSSPAQRQEGAKHERCVFLGCIFKGFPQQGGSTAQ